jgi:hypothetical protein
MSIMLRTTLCNNNKKIRNIMRLLINSKIKEPRADMISFSMILIMAYVLMLSPALALIVMTF